MTNTRRISAENTGLARPRTNTEVCGVEVDAYWPDQDLVVEVGSYRYHRTRRIEHEPQAVADDLRRLVDSRPPHPS